MKHTNLKYKLMTNLFYNELIFILLEKDIFTIISIIYTLYIYIYIYIYIQKLIIF